MGDSSRENTRWAWGICSARKHGSAKKIKDEGILKGHGSQPKGYQWPRTIWMAKETAQR